ncbi:MAG: hypothetical protein FJ100_24175, partial [Deltaproteobacteria bacterium]|nr:hypothetical protein [Deltaproteobacteria bacterium]
ADAAAVPKRAAAPAPPSGAGAAKPVDPLHIVAPVPVPRTNPRLPALATLAGAGLVAVTGIGFAVAAVVADSDADRWRVPGSGKFDTNKLSATKADEVIADINGKWTAAAVAGGVAVATSAVGTWLWTRSGRSAPAVTVAADGRKLGVVWTF